MNHELECLEWSEALDEAARGRHEPAFHAHHQACELCQERLVAARTTRAALAQLPAMPSMASEEILAAVRRRSVQPDIQPRSYFLKSALWMAACAAILFLALLPATPPPPGATGLNSRQLAEVDAGQQDLAKAMRVLSLALASSASTAQGEFGKVLGEGFHAGFSRPLREALPVYLLPRG